MDENFGKSIRGTTSGVIGNGLQFENWAIPFIKEMTDLLVEEGYDESLNYSTDMGKKNTGGSPMALGEYIPYIIFTVYVKEQIGAWAISKFCDLILKGVKNVLSCKGYSGRLRIMIEFDEGIRIGIDSPAKSNEDAKLLAASILQAQQDAIASKQISKTTDKPLLYRITDGKLHSKSTLNG